MSPLLEELCGLLSEQKSVLESMLELSLEERRIIVAGEAESLEDIIRREFRELSKLGAIEKKRLALHKDVGAALGLSEKDITVTAIAEKAEPKDRETIRRLQTELSALIHRHTELNMENRELIKSHIEYSEAVLDIMVDSEDPLNNFYGGDGKASRERKKSTGFFDGRA